MLMPSLKYFVASASMAMASAATTGHAGAAMTVTGPKIEFIKIDETITLRRMVVGPASPKGTVLFLHGFPETLTVWKQIAETLGKDYEVHVFD